MKKLILIFLLLAGYTPNAQSQNLQGTYLDTGYFFHPSSPRAISMQKPIVQISPNVYQVDLGDLGTTGRAFQFTVDANNQLINWLPVGITPLSPSSNFMTLDNPGSFTYPGIQPGAAPFLQSTYNNTYDPATQTFWMHYGYAVGATDQTGYTRQIYEKYTFISSSLAPAPIAFTPDNGTTGTLVTITGSSLANTSNVTMGTNYFGCDTFMIVSDTVLQMVVGNCSSVLTPDIVIANPVGTASIGPFTYTEPIINNTEWQYVGSPGFSANPSYYVNMAMSKNNIPFVIYEDSATHLAVVKNYFANTWLDVGTNPSAGPCTNTQIAIDNNGTPFISYADSLYGGRITVRKFDGINWVNVGNPGFGSTQYTNISYKNFADLAIDNNNMPIVVSDSLDYPTIYKFNGTTWQYIPYIDDTLSNEASLAINKTDNSPYLFYGNSNNKPVVKKYDGTNWVTVGNTGYLEGNVYYARIAIDNNGNAIAAFQDDNLFERISSYQLSGGVWNAGNSKRFSRSHSYNLSLNFYNHNLPIVSFTDGSYNDKGTVMKYNSSGAWENVGVRGFAPVNILERHALAVDSNNVPYLVFIDLNNGNKVSVMKYYTGLLPLHFTSFTISRQEQYAQLNWQTAQEVNTSYFIVQRKLNGNSFTDIGKVNTVGSGNNQYHFTDDVSTLGAGTVYYRLQITDKDGKSSYSDVRNLKLQSNPRYTIMPNPAKDYITVSGSHIGNITITNAAGRQVISAKTPRINISGLAKGIYFVNMQSDDGSSQTEKLMVE